MSMKKSTFDAVIVGGGAAGLFAAVQASARGRRILLLEKNSRCGKKLLITGKGRCNVTNACTAEEALKNIPRNGRFLYSAMAAFPPEAAMAFFEQGGCPLKVERGNRVFPVSDRSADVLNVLERALQRGGVERRQTTVTGLSIADGAQGAEVYGLSTESCAICAHCAWPDGPCRHPDRMFPCVESHGIVVTALAERHGIEYQYGGNVVTWFSLLLYRETPDPA